MESAHTLGQPHHNRMYGKATFDSLQRRQHMHYTAQHAGRIHQTMQQSNTTQLAVPQHPRLWWAAWPKPGYLLTVVMLLSLSNFFAAAEFAQPGGTGGSGRDDFMSGMTPPERAAHCEAHYQHLFQNINADLQRWKSSGISLQLLDQTIQVHTTRSMKSSRKGFLAGFRAGQAILPDEPQLKMDLAHHASLFFVYMHALVEIERLFSTEIPDVDFVINTVDVPLALAPTSNALPVMRFSKSPAHADILIPTFHFYISQTSNQHLINMAQETNSVYPWDSRQPVLFGRFSSYVRHRQPDDPYTHRLGANKTTICRNDSAYHSICDVRDHFMAWSAPHQPDIDVRRQPKITMLKHAAYKYLVHLDGQGLSSRLEQLLPLGSLIFKEESGFYGFYHHLLKPYEHYVPFWKQGPEEVLEALAWAKQNDDKAEQIGRAGQDLAAKYLTREALACYWYKLLKEYSSLLTYNPSEVTGKAFRRFNMPMTAYLSTRAKTWQGGSTLQQMTVLETLQLA